MSRYRLAWTATLLLICCGCPGAAFDPPAKSEAVAENPAEPAPASPDNPVAMPAAAPAPEQPPPNALQREAEFVDRNAYLREHPEAIEKEKNIINASDPFTASAQGYYAAVSTLTVSAYKHDIDLWKAMNDNKWPTFEAYKAILDMHDVKLKGLRKNQVYAYDDQTGSISILEIPETPAAP